MKTFTTYAAKAKQFLNLLQGYTKGIRLTAILILLLMGVSNAWADPYISGFGFQFEDDGGKWFKNSTEIMNLNLGSKTNLKILYIYANGNKNGGNLCDNNYFKYEIYGNTNTANWGGSKHSSVDWATPTYKWGTENGSTAQIDLVKNRKPGDYRMEFYFSFQGSNSNEGCGTWYDCKYSGGNWKFSWSIPDPVITITGANDLVVGTSTNIKAQISQYPVGATISQVQVSGNTTSKSATGSTDNLTVSSVTPNASGKNGITVTVTVKFGTGGTKDYTYTYNVTPPAVNNFKVAASNVVSGTGTIGEPYVIAYEKTTTLTVSGNKASTDANSSLYAKFGNNTYSSTLTETLTPSSTKQSIEVKAKYYNSKDDLSGAESSQTIYYRSEQVYTVTFNANGHGTAPAAQTVSQGSKATQPAAPTATGYTFGGWYKEAGCTNAFDFNTEINADITLYAKWTPVPTVTVKPSAEYYLAGIDNQVQLNITFTNVQSGWKYRVHNETNNGYYGPDWQPIYNDGTITWTMAGSVAAGTPQFRVYLYDAQNIERAKSDLFTLNMESASHINIRLNTNNRPEDAAGGTLNPTGFVIVSKNISAAISTTANNNFIFKGWTANPENNVTFADAANPSTTIKATAGATVYANYVGQYTVTLNNQGATTAGATSVTATYDAAMPSIASNLPEKTGYTFNGYFDATSGGTKYYNANGSSAKNWDKTANTTLYAQWTPAKYDITYKDQDGSSFSGTHADGAPEKHTYGTETTLKSASKAGYTFGGWHTDAACTNEVTSLGATDYTADITLYAKWEIRTLYIHASWIGGQNAWQTVQLTPAFEDGKAIYTYNGTQIYAQPTSGTNYNTGHHFHFLNSLKGIENQNTQDIAYNYDNVHTPTASGFLTDAEIHETASANPTIQFGLTHQSDLTITLTLQDGALPTVHIAATPYYTISYYNGSSVAFKVEAVLQGASITLPTVDDKPGYTFKGWFDSNEKETKNGDSMPGNDLHLGTRWTPISYTITYNLNGGSGVENSHYTIETATFNLPTPSKTGYTFGGWYDNEGCTGEDITTIPQGSIGDKTLYAKWEERKLFINTNWMEGWWSEEMTHTTNTTYTYTKEAMQENPYYFRFLDAWGGNLAYGWDELAEPPTTNSDIVQNIESRNDNGYINFNLTRKSDVTITLTLQSPNDDPKPTVRIEADPYYTITWMDGQGHQIGEVQEMHAGETITPPADPSREGYTFAGWSPEVESKMPDDDLIYTAQWTINQYTINYGVVGEAHGTIQLDGGTKVTTSASTKANYDTEHAFTAEPANDYKIGGWYSDANGANKIDAAGTNKTYNIASLTDDIAVYVRFVEAAEVMSQVTVTATAGGAVSPSGTVDVGNRTPILFTATPAPGYRFDHWTYSEGVVKVVEGSNTHEQIRIIATGTGTLTAHFVRVHTVNFFATPAAAGTATATATVNGNANAITSGEKLDDNTSVTFTAAVANAYNGQCTFVRWVDGAGNPLSSNATYNHTVKEDITVKAIFKIKQYTLTFSASDGGYVSATANNSAIASPANLDYNTSVTLTAEPDAGCAFEGWYEGGTWKSSSTSYDVTLTANKTIEARFTKGTTVYMKAIEYWKKDHPRYAIYYWGAGDKEGWHDMTNVDCNGDIYEGYVPAGYTNFKFVRLAPSTSNEWENKWNETPDLTTTDNAGKMYIHPHVYLKPNSNWKQSNARFAAYFYADGKEAKWNSMNDLDGDGIYSCEIPTGYTSVIFCRMNPDHTDNRWNTGEDTEETKRFWNQTTDLTVPADDNSNNLYTVTEGAWDKGAGSWSDGPHKNGWQTYAEPSYKITYPTNGTITVTKAGNNVANGTLLNMGDEIKITFTPAVGNELINYNVEYATETGEEGVYTVCGPTKITAEFAKAGTARTVYLRPNEDWLRDEPIFAAYAWNNSSKANKWYTMTTKADDYTGAYSCNISSTYDWVTFVRIKPAGRDGSDGSLIFENAWNQTKDLAIIDKDNDKTNDHKLRFAIGDKVGGEGDDKEKYDGAWEENTPIWGLTANFNDWTAEKAVFKGYPGHLDEMPSFGTSHAFKLYNFFYESNQYFGNAGTMKRANSGQWWTMVATEQANCQMTLDVKGDYIYQMRFLTVGTELRKQISVTYPEANMYYLMYEEETDEGSKQRISYGIGRTGEDRLDTVSFFVDVTKSAKIYILDGNQNKVGGPYTIIGTGGKNPGGAMAPQRRTEDNPELSIEKGCGITESGVYNFVAQQDGKGIKLLIDKWHAYTGAYYIRTDAASGGWGGYKQNGNKMTYTSYADKNHNFDHYYCKWITSLESSYSNVKFCVANDYSHKLSDEWDGDEIIEKADVPTGCLPEDANVRFGWDSKTNELSRAYISGSAKAEDRFLVLTGNEYLLDIEGKAFPNGTGNREGLKANEEIFDDMGNWLYQLDVKANTQTAIKLTAQFNNRVQTFFGDARAAADGEEMIDATTPEYHKVRMIYNFKTNHLLVAWLLDPQQDVNNGNVASDVLIIRENHGDANQLQFKQGLNQMAVKTAYATITFTKDHVTDTEKSQWQRYEYWVSFPFDVKISDVFGFGEYGTEWIMQLYDGASRAKNGLWVDSPTYWKYITNRNYTLKAGVGYVLKLQASKMTDETAFMYSDKVSLYFPSTPNADGNTIISATPDTQHEIPEHECTIPRDNRYIYDSHWNLIGVPGYANIANFNTAASLSPVNYDNQQVSFYYAYNAANNTYQATTATSNFKNMHSYMVQFAGTINWSTKEAIKPVELAARRNSDTELEKAIFRLELAQGEKMADQTFVQLQQEGATPEFDMNLDLTKIINSGANIYTLVGNSRIQTAGNALPMDEAMVVPVGVKIDAEGEYTFRMPDGTEGMVVELVDYETNNRTNLLLTDYTVTLPKGTSENRFALHIQPQKDVVTSLENIGEGVNNGEAVNKYLIDGKLIIRTAEGIFDAQGHRL